MSDNTLTSENGFNPGGLESDRPLTAYTKVKLRVDDPLRSMLTVHREVSIKDRLGPRIDSRSTFRSYVAS